MPLTSEHTGSMAATPWPETVCIPHRLQDKQLVVASGWKLWGCPGREKYKKRITTTERDSLSLSLWEVTAFITSRNNCVSVSSLPAMSPRLRPVRNLACQILSMRFQIKEIVFSHGIAEATLKEP